MKRPETHLWPTVFGLSLGVCVSNGFARFAYGLILPAMRDDLGWSYTQAGWINTANALGYVVGAVVTLLLIGRFSASRLFSTGMLATSASVLATGLTDDFVALTLWRFLAGLFGAPVFIAGGALAAALFEGDQRRSALAIALYFGGGGLGVALSGAALPGFFASQGSSAWPAAWLALGLVSLVCCSPALWASERLHRPASGGRRRTMADRLPVTKMLFVLSGYGLFATGYIVYLTFLVAWMVVLSSGPVAVSGVWVIVGLGIMVSPFVWRPVLAGFAGGMALALATAATALGTILPIVLPTNAGLVLSAAIFGLAVFIAPSAVTGFAGKNLPQELRGRAIALFTTLFAIGQTVGPVAAGAIGDRFGSISYGLSAAAAILALGAVLAACQRPLAR